MPFEADNLLDIGQWNPKRRTVLVKGNKQVLLWHGSGVLGYQWYRPQPALLKRKKGPAKLAEPFLLASKTLELTLQVDGFLKNLI